MTLTERDEVLEVVSKMIAEALAEIIPMAGHGAKILGGGTVLLIRPDTTFKDALRARTAGSNGDKHGYKGFYAT